MLSIIFRNPWYRTVFPGIDHVLATSTCPTFSCLVAEHFSLVTYSPVIHRTIETCPFIHGFPMFNYSKCGYGVYGVSPMNYTMMIYDGELMTYDGGLYGICMAYGISLIYDGYDLV